MNQRTHMDTPDSSAQLDTPCAAGEGMRFRER